MADERHGKFASILGVQALIIGNVEGQGDLEVRGKIQGEVRLDGRLLIAKGGVVLGNVSATLVTVAGTLRGDVVATDSLTLEASSEVDGNLRAPRVALEAGARVRGQLNAGGMVSEPRANEIGVQTPPPTVALTSSVRGNGNPAPRLATPPPEPVIPPAPRLSPIASPASPKDAAESFLDDETEDELETSEAQALDTDAPAKRRRKRRRRGGRIEGRDPISVAPADNKSASATEAGPRIPTFQKGAHAQRRD